MFDKELALTQIAQSQLRAQYYKLRVENQVYLERLGKAFHGSFQGPPFTAEELRRDEIHTMHRHITLAQDLIEFLAQELHKRDRGEA